MKLDFCETKKIHPGGMLVLLSYIEVVNRDASNKIKIRCAPGSIPAQLFKHFECEHFTGVSYYKNMPKDKTVTKWRYIFGHESDGSKISDLLTSYRVLSGSVAPDGLYESLTEAITNVKHHAYINSGLPSSKWWIFSSYDECDGGSDYNTLYIAVYDHGIGIKNSMKKNPKWIEKIANFVNYSDSVLERKLLREAVEGDRTSTGLSYRGKGLPEMKEFVTETQTGSMYILSGRAQYMYTASNQISNCILCDDELRGTLILWSIPLQKVRAHHG